MNQPPTHESRSELVSHGTDSAHQVDFRVDTPPARDQQIEPHVVWVVGQAVADGLQTDIVVIDRAGGDHAELLSWEGEPVARLDLTVDVEVQVFQDVAA